MYYWWTVLIIQTYDGHSGKYVNAVCSISDSLFASSGSDKVW